MKKLAARDFEDLLQVRISLCDHVYSQHADNGIQCAIPVFDSLLPEPHNSAVLRLLFICSHWHGLAKLRLHTDNTLKILDNTTREIGVAFRKFTVKTCPAFNARELKREVEARQRRKQERGGANGSAPTSSGPRPKTFNLQIYKFHSLGDYADQIRTFGTSDSFSTEPVSSQSVHLLNTETILSRANLSIERQNLATAAQTESFLSNNWLVWNVVKRAFDESEECFQARMRPPLICCQIIIILASHKICIST
jgi:hypothetical protein